MSVKQNLFRLESPFELSAAQYAAREKLVGGLNSNKRDQVLLGVTGSGKTFTMASIIASTGRPAIILAPNKTLVAQLFQEFKAFFPHNAVEYFVSYYDYYQPEAYIARTDQFIEKDALINDQIDRLRHSATRSLLTRDDVIVVASVSSIYGLGDREVYMANTLEICSGSKMNIRDLTHSLVAMQYNNRSMDFERGTFRVRGDVIDIFPSHSEDKAWRISFFDQDIEGIWEFDALTGNKLAKLDKITIFSNSHHITNKDNIKIITEEIAIDLQNQYDYFVSMSKHVEAQRIKSRTEYDIELLLTTGICKGIENYTRYLSRRKAGLAPPTLFEYMPEGSMLFLDESHVMVPQIGAMYSGDRARKENLINYGFRLPSALDNRPLKFEEWNVLRGQSVYVSATPSKYETALSGPESIVEQLVRPTGLVDPEYEIRPIANQVNDLVIEAKKVIERGLRVMVTTLTKKMAEDLHEFFIDEGVTSEYLHSDVDTMKRIEIINKLRKGQIDVLVGVNLLREGLDIPECGLMAIMDADREGFLRSETSLIQTIGRAARNSEGRVILYADKMTGSMTRALGETDRRRAIQIAYNKEHGIIPKTIIKAHHDMCKMFSMDKDASYKEMNKSLGLNKEFATKEAAIKFYTRKMHEFAKEQKFEEAKLLRDRLKELEKGILY